MKKVILSLCKETSEYLRSIDETFPVFEYNEHQFEVLTAFGGAGYGEPLQEALELAQQFKEDTGITLDPTYTSKGLLGMCSYIKEHVAQDEVVLFLNTFCGNDYSELIKNCDTTKLPKEFQKYFK